MARRIGARRRCALSDDHQKARACHRDKRQSLAPAHIRYSESRQACCYRTDDGDSMSGEVECCTRCHSTDNREQRSGQAG